MGGGVTARSRRHAGDIDGAGTWRAGVRRVGLLGGTFDPPHLGHLALAEAALDQLGLDEVVFIPAGSPPHKLGRRITPAADRLAMVELATSGLERVSVDRLEIDRPGPSFTVDTVEALLERAAAAGERIAPTLIMSSDAFADLPAWRDPERLVGLARIAVAARPGHASPDLVALERRVPGVLDRANMIDGPRVDVSATDIRRRVAAGQPIDDLVPSAVVDYITDHHLYREQNRRHDRT